MTMNKRKLVMDSNKHMLNYIEIIPGQLVFVTFKRDVKPNSNKHRTYIRVDNFLHYEGFYNDFGPYNICNLYHYCKYLNLELEAAKKANNRLLVQYTWIDKEKRLNSAFAIGSYAIIYLNKTADEIYKILTNNETQMYSKYNDASAVLSDYKLSLLDCLRAIEKANKFGFFNFDDFNYLEYEHYEIVESGDLNWILPNKFIAFCGPHSLSGIDNKGYTHHSPEKYFEYFEKNNVTTIVRLNYKFYESSNFTDAGFKHYDLIFRDGSTPSDTILNQFLDICERTDGAIAVHCKAGLGRTGSLIGAYIMKHYRLTAMETIAWIRLCRPGSVIGHQQQWMEEKQLSLWIQGEAYRRDNKIKSLKIHETGVYSYKNQSCLDDSLIDSKMVQTSDNIDGVDTEDDETQTENIDDIIGELHEKTKKRSRSVTGISEKVDTMKLDDANGNLVKTNDKNGNIITSGASPTISRIAKSRGLAALAKKKSSNINGAAGGTNTNTLPAKLPSLLSNDSADQITQGDELNQIKFRRHHRSITVAVPQTEAIPKPIRCYHSRAKSQSNTRSLEHHDTTSLSSSPTMATKSSLAKNVNTRFAYVVVRTTGNNTNSTMTPPTTINKTESISHIPTITSSNKLIKSNKQSKDEGTTKRASVRRATIGRTKLSRSPVKPLAVSSVTSSNVTTVTTSTTATTPVEDILGPITRSRMCRFCTTTGAASTTTTTITSTSTNVNIEDNGNELTNCKRGKRSLSTTRFYDKKNKLRKNQVLVPTSITGTTITRRLRKEASLDSALADLSTDNEAKDDLSLQESPLKDPPKSRLRKPSSIRSASSQKALPTSNN